MNAGALLPPEFRPRPMEITMPQKLVPVKPGCTTTSDTIQRNGENANANPLTFSPAAVGRAGENVKGNPVTSVLADSLLPHVAMAVEDLSNLGTSLRVLVDLAERAHRAIPYGPEASTAYQPLTQLCVLARMMEYIAFDTSNSVDCALQRFREQAAELGVQA